MSSVGALGHMGLAGSCREPQRGRCPPPLGGSGPHGPCKQHISDQVSSLEVPHLKGSIRSRYDISLVVLEASDGACVCCQRVLTPASLRILDAECRIGSRRNKFVVAEIQRSNELGMPFQRVGD